MRGDERDQDGMFSYISLEQRVPQDHPLRAVRKLTDAVLRTLSPEFDALYADSGRPSIAPEYILRALLLQVFYSVRSERLLVEQIDYNLLFRWFVGHRSRCAILQEELRQGVGLPGPCVGGEPQRSDRRSDGDHG